MWPCRMIDRLIQMVPLKAWQDILIRRHVSGCPACQGKLAAKEEVRAVMIQKQDLVEVKDFWPEIKRSLFTEPKIPARTYRSFWQGAAIAAGLVVIILTSLWLYWGFRGNGATDPGHKLLIDYVKIEDKPARTYVFKPQGADMTLVWVEKNGEGE